MGIGWQEFLIILVLVVAIAWGFRSRLVRRAVSNAMGSVQRTPAVTAARWGPGDPRAEVGALLDRLPDADVARVADYCRRLLDQAPR